VEGDWQLFALVDARMTGWTAVESIP
jgi:hypothetical protein